MMKLLRSFALLIAAGCVFIASTVDFVNGGYSQKERARATRISGISERSEDYEFYNYYNDYNGCEEYEWEEAWELGTCSPCPEAWEDKCYDNPMDACDSDDICIEASRRNCWVSCEHTCCTSVIVSGSDFEDLTFNFHKLDNWGKPIYVHSSKMHKRQRYLYRDDHGQWAFGDDYSLAGDIYHFTCDEECPSSCSNEWYKWDVNDFQSSFSSINVSCE